MGQQRAERRGRRRWGKRPALLLGSGKASGEEPDRGAFDIAFDTGDLAREADLRSRFETQALVEQLRAVDEGVAMEPAEPRELRLFEAGDGTEHAHLLGVTQLRLEA